MSIYSQNDRRPVITFTIRRDGAALDVSSATAVYARVRLVDSSATLFKNTLTNNSDGTDGKMDLEFTASQLATEGEYETQLEILWSAGVTETVPNIFRFPVDAKFAEPA